VNPPLQLERITLSLLTALAYFVLSPTARAICREGCDIPNGNTFLGDDALISNTTGGENTAIGDAALAANTTGSANTAMGAFALRFNTTGGGNTATGFTTLQNNTTGDFNTANGEDALFANTTGSSNTASGASALITNTTGDDNTATGATALFNNTTGSNNTATGSAALSHNTTGDNNTATGAEALFLNNGSANTASGFFALRGNTTGNGNTAVGFNVLRTNTTGSENTASGEDALYFNTTGSSNIALGFRAGYNLTTGGDNIDIGNEGVAGESDTIRIGTQGTQTATYIAGVSGGAVAGSAVKVNAAGKIGTAPSSVRFKQNVKSMGDTSDALYALRPVTFHYKQEIDPEGTRQFGLVAEEGEKVNPDLVVCDADGNPYTVRYEAVDAMLLNEFLEEHGVVQEQIRKIHELEATVAELKSAMAQQEKQVKTLSASFQKVSERLEMKGTPRVVENTY
jgi:uncharacterized coiled-coil protein SlyX